MNDYAAQTRILQSQNDQFGATQFPLYLNSAFAYENPADLEKVFAGQKFGYIYGRIQNPTLMNIERKIAAITGGRGAVLTATGMAAISGAVLTLASAGDTIIAHRAIFGGTIALFDRLFSKLGLNVAYTNFHDSEALRRVVKNTPSAVLLFCESMGNPALDLQDLETVTAIAEEKNLPVFLDSTLTPPGFLDLSPAPVALEMHSSTKFMAGNNTVLGGALIDKGTYDWTQSRDPVLQDFSARFGKDNAFLASFRYQALQNLGMTQQPAAAALTGFSLETMHLRVERQFENAKYLAEYLVQQLGEDAVHYPGLKSSPYYTRVVKYMPHGGGALITIDFGSKERAFSFGKALKLVRNMTNLGDSRTLAVHPASTIFRDSSEQKKKEAGVTPGMLRISLGLEDIEDLKADFSQALECADKTFV
ncbi:MAG: aminotransferase class I/II-fold pyridoxal phosphate-dependent enzyme [Salinispira sp.]